VQKLKKGWRYTNPDGVSYELLEPAPGNRWVVRVESEFFSCQIYYPARELILMAKKMRPPNLGNRELDGRDL
jgi:hypothetical protein